MNKKIIILTTILFSCSILIIFSVIWLNNRKINGEENTITQNTINLELNQNNLSESKSNRENEWILTSSDDLFLKDIDGRKTNYSFKYGEEIFKAVYTKDNWHIEDSYKIKNKSDMSIICKALIDIHHIHGKDMTSYRTVDDLVYEWLQHNLAYEILPEESPWKENVRSVDLDPEDQGRTIQEMYEARTGKKFNIKDIK